MATMQVNLDSNWADGFKGKGIVQGDGFKITVGIPSSLGGSGEGANPKELFVSAIAACFLSTLAAISENKKLPIHTLNVSTQSTSDDNSFAVKHIVKLTLESSAKPEDIQAAKNIIQASDNACLIGTLAKKSGVTIEVDPIIEIQAA